MVHALTDDEEETNERSKIYIMSEPIYRREREGGYDD